MRHKLVALWRKMSWSWSPESERDSADASVRNLWLHWFPAKISRSAMSWNYSLWLGTATASLFLILTVTGVMLMFFYVPSTERAYGSVKDLEYAVSFGRILRNQHRWAAEGMVALAFLHNGAGVLHRRLPRNAGAELGGGRGAAAGHADALVHRLPAAVGPAGLLGDHGRHQYRKPGAVARTDRALPDAGRQLCRAADAAAVLRAARLLSA